MTTVSHQQATTTGATDDRRLNAVRDGVAAALIATGALLPWNLYCGLTIADTAGWALALIVVAALLSVASVVLTHVGSMSLSEHKADPQRLNQVRLLLNLPSFALVFGFATFAIVQAVRAGGTTAVPPGVGPGAWLTVAGAVLAAAPAIIAGGDAEPRVEKACRIIAIASLAVAGAAVLFNLYYRTRFVLPAVGDDGTGTQNLTVAVAALLYGIVALIPIVVVGRWILSRDRAAALATVLTAIAAAVAGTWLWWLPVGRDLDAFHGIAQTTSTAGVGFEGYLAWAAVGALLATSAVRAAFGRDSARLWREASRKGLLLIGIWCLCSAVLRIVDVVLSSVLALPDPPYNGTAMMAFDVAAAVVAIWVLINSKGRGGPTALLTVSLGVVFVLTVCRVVIGVAMVPRVQPLNPADITDVYGNTLAQQITSTFDVALCLLAVMLFAGAIARRERATHDRRAPAESTSVFDKVLSPTTAASDPWKPPVPADPATTIITPAPGATTAMPTAQLGTARIAGPSAAMTAALPSQSATAKIARPDSAHDPRVSDRAADVLAESSRRFAAGTTYGKSASPDDTGDRR